VCALKPVPKMRTCELLFRMCQAAACTPWPAPSRACKSEEGDARGGCRPLPARASAVLIRSGCICPGAAVHVPDPPWQCGAMGIDTLTGSHVPVPLPFLSEACTVCFCACLPMCVCLVLYRRVPSIRTCNMQGHADFSSTGVTLSLMATTCSLLDTQEPPVRIDKMIGNSSACWWCEDCCTACCHGTGRPAAEGPESWRVRM